MSIRIKFLKDIKIENPCLIVGFPGIGYVAKFALDYIVEKLKAEKFAEIYSHSFPSFIIVKSNGLFEPIRTDLFYSGNFIFVTGNAQPITPEGQHELSDFIISELMKRYKISMVYAMAAYVVEGRSGEPKVYGVVTDPMLMESLKKYGVYPMSGGSISGANGIILTYAKEMGIPGVCLLSETLPYTYGYYADIKAAKALVEVITSITGIKIDLTDIEEKARGFEITLKKIKEAEEETVREELKKEWRKDLSYLW
ncbi:MAG: PAC2 family protein [Candidatus Verstraetearchaeota archaeon]|jgi:uncharacterized protein (TIGR00162 family)|nr:PAC2 family protein [Candidatus Verstraetearchaeota archaeon]